MAGCVWIHEDFGRTVTAQELALELLEHGDRPVLLSQGLRWVGIDPGIELGDGNVYLFPMKEEDEA